MRFGSMVGAGCLAASVSACCSHPPDGVTGDPKTIKLETALEDVVTSLEAMKKKLNDAHETLGTFPCKITTVFNLATSATGTESGGGTLGGGYAGATLAVNLSEGESSTGSRGSQITIELDSIACLSKDTLGAARPENIDRLWNIMAHLRPAPAGGGAGPMTQYEKHQRLDVR